MYKYSVNQLGKNEIFHLLQKHSNKPIKINDLQVWLDQVLFRLGTGNLPAIEIPAEFSNSGDIEVHYIKSSGITLAEVDEESAINYLYRLLDTGLEFPEAVYRTSVKFSLTLEQVESLREGV